MGRYLLADDDGEYSADAGDYWDRPDTYQFTDMALIKRSHRFVTVTGRVVTGPYLLKYNPTMRDLRRLLAAAQ